MMEATNLAILCQMYCFGPMRNCKSVVISWVFLVLQYVNGARRQAAVDGVLGRKSACSLGWKTTTYVVVSNTTHRLRVVFKHFSGFFLGAPFLHTLPLQVSLLRLLENLIRSPVSAQELACLLVRQ